MSREEFQQYWREVHGPLVAKHATDLNIHRYVQVHTLDDPINDQLSQFRSGMEPAYDGAAQLWWTTREELVSASGTEAGRAASRELLEDEARFIDLPQSPLWLCHEYPQVNPTPEVIEAREDNDMLNVFYCVRHPSNRAIYGSC